MSEVLSLTSSGVSPMHYGSLERTPSSWSKVAEKRVTDAVFLLDISTPSQMQRSSYQQSEQEYKPPTMEGMAWTSGEIPGAPKEALETAFQDREEHDGRGYPPNRDPHFATETLLQRRRRAAMELYDQMMAEGYYDNIRALPARQKEPRFKKERLRPLYKRASSSSSNTVLGDGVIGALTPATPGDNSETPFGENPPFFMRRDSSSGLLVPMPVKGKHVININGDTYNGPIKNSNIGGHRGQNSVKNGPTHDVEAQRLLGVPPGQNTHNKSNVDALLIIIFALLALICISFFVDLDVLLALLKMVNGKGST
ncbi:hypothetical protein PC9H_007107 [Pleurotus ostreatus]|uniref:Uncharacterized protein n=1 Tax=Pleurotus ostreatus TaxID=5322 RepID=A0A8H6ZQN9_PLEOS|nr:uncharacterized protein PC9H_007107 [Pleurotus ostreatus]KAF7427890.1 hypothetical protein PC9H_007107 [Pleurotus ostreatus]